MSSTASPDLTTDVSTDGLSTSHSSSAHISSAVSSVQSTTKLAASFTTTVSNTMSSANWTFTGASPRTAKFTTTMSSSGNSSQSAGTTTTIYSGTTEDRTGSSTITGSSGNNTSVAYPNYWTTNTPNASTSSTKLSISSKDPSIALTKQTTKLSRIDATTDGSPAIYCPEPLPITGGKLLSSGPYLANASSAVFSCIAGYALTGQAEIGCSITGTWDKHYPKCVPINNRPNVNNHISLEDSARVPVWLTVILSIAFGLLCLLLLSCLLVYCLKLFGCWKGSAVGTKLVVREAGVESGQFSRGNFMAKDFGSGGKNKQFKHAMYEENSKGGKPTGDLYAASKVPVKSTGGQGGSYRNGPYNQYNSRRGNFQHERGKAYTSKPFTDDFYRRENEEGRADHETKRTYQRLAKMPANQTWMPHSRNFRNINTSTK